MAALMISLPSEVANLFDVEIQGGEKEINKHVTILYLGDHFDKALVGDVVTATYEVLANTPPIVMSCHQISEFSPKGDSKPVICPVESAGLHTLRSELVRALHENGIEHDNKYPEFKPHVTLGFYGPKTKYPQKLKSPVTWTVGEVSLWCADRGDGELRVDFQLGSALKVATSNPKGALFRALVRLANYSR